MVGVALPCEDGRQENTIQVGRAKIRLERHSMGEVRLRPEVELK